jgi:hypothetical protein
MSAYQVAAANSFDRLWGGYKGFGNASPFADALGQQRDIAGALTGTGLTGQFALKGQEMANQAALERQKLANENALAQVELSGQWQRRIGKDVIAANRDTSRRAGLLGILSGGGGLFGGGGQQPRFAGTGLDSSPFANLQNTLTGFNNVTGLMNNAYDQTVGAWGQGGRATVTRSLQSMPRPTALS